MTEKNLMAPERMPLIPEAERSPAQQAAANAIINGPRKAIFGPFIPLMHCPGLMEKIGDLGASIRFESGLPDRIRELAIAATARATNNSFEWRVHAPAAVKAGVAQATIDSMAERRIAPEAPEDERIVMHFVEEILRDNSLSDACYQDVERRYGKPGVVELTVLVGYFAMICWVMNVARTP